MTRRPRTLLVAGSLAVAAGIAGAACLPDVRFQQLVGPDGGGDDGDGGGGDGPAPDAPAGDAPPGDAGADGDGAAPTALGPFAGDQYDSYGESAWCAVRGGTLYCWGGVGSNQFAQLGLPAQTEDSGVSWPHPTAVPTTKPASQIAQIALGVIHGCILYGRSVFCHGNTDYEQLGNPTAQNGPTEVPVIGLPASGLDVIAAAAYSTCGITLVPDAGSPSNVYCWGMNGEGQLGRSTSQQPSTAVPVTGDVDGGPLGAIPDAVAIAGGGRHHCALTQGHVILCWGGTEYFESGPLQGPTGSCPSGNESTCMFQPQPVVLPGGEVATGIAVGSVHSCAVAQSGNVYCWGTNQDFQLGVGTSVSMQTCTNLDQSTGPCSSTPLKVANVSDIKLLRAGGWETCGLDGAHHAFCWGYNSDGALGAGDRQDHTTPVEVIDVTTGIPPVFDDIAVGADGACGRTGDTLYCWRGGALGTASGDAGAPLAAAPAPVQF